MRGTPAELYGTENAAGYSPIGSRINNPGCPNLLHYS